MKLSSKNRRKLSRGFSKTIGSYLLVFLIPFLLVSIVWYQASVKSINQQVAMTAKNQLLQLKYSLENNFLQLNNLTQQLTRDHHLSLNQLNHPYYAKEGKETLQTYKVTNKIVEEVYLHFKEIPDQLYSSTGKMSMDTFLNQTLIEVDVSKSFILEQFQTTTPHLLTANEKISGRHYSKFFYVVPLQNEEMVTYGSAIYVIRESSLNQMLDMTNSDGVSTNYLVNSAYQVLASTGNDELTAYLGNPEKMATAISTGNLKLEKQDYLIEQLVNPELKLSFVSVSNPAKALEKINEMQRSFIYIFATILSLGSLTVFYFGLAAWKPIRKIEYLVREYNKDPKVYLNSIEDVHDNLQVFLAEHQELHKEIQMQTPHAREQVLRKLLSGRLKAKDMELLLHSVQVKFPIGAYFVLCIDSKAIRLAEKADEELFLIDFIEEIIKSEYTAYATEILSKEIVAVVIGFSPQTDSAMIVSEIRETLYNQIKHVPSFGVGSIVPEIDLVNGSYIEALAALEYCIGKDKKVVCYEDISSENTTATISYPDGKKLKLSQSLTQGNLVVAKETIHWLIAEGIKYQPSPKAQKMYGFYILNTVAKIGGDLGGEVILQKAEKSADFLNLIELEQNLFDLSATICSLVKTKPSNQESKLKEKIFCYIQQHYTSSQLSLEQVAEEFDLSVSYLSRFIKKEIGLTFSKYIQELRLERIKQQLTQTDIPIKEIIRESGYYDVSNFTRKFRILVGVTPGQFRAMNQSFEE